MGDNEPHLNFEGALAGERVLVTGHTGFTGGWLALWLRVIGAEVTGFALPPATEPNLFTAARVDEHLTSRIGDIRDFAAVARVMADAQPRIVFHLAAQPLVSRSFADPLETISTNVVGTANVLEAARLQPSVEAFVCVTTDKVYADEDARRGYREGDRLGGKDPYSASKAGAELVAACYRATLVARGNGMRVATARGGNIIGGGDWSDDRIVPDFVRAAMSKTPLVLRSPTAVRPWQHVLALVHGYLVLASRLMEGQDCPGAFNFGPVEDDAMPVAALVERLAALGEGPSIRHQPGSFPETPFLRLDSTAARDVLDWHPPLGIDDALRLTADWYRDYYARPTSAHDLTVRQIDEYRRRLGTGI